MLRGLGLLLAHRAQHRHQAHEDQAEVLAAHAELELPERLYPPGSQHARGQPALCQPSRHACLRPHPPTIAQLSPTGASPRPRPAHDGRRRPVEGTTHLEEDAALDVSHGAAHLHQAHIRGALPAVHRLLRHTLDPVLHHDTGRQASTQTSQRRAAA